MEHVEERKEEPFQNFLDGSKEDFFSMWTWNILSSSTILWKFEELYFFFFWFCQLEMLETFPPIDMGFCFLINYVRTEMIQSMTFFESEQKICQIECTFDGYDDMICTPLSNSQNSTRNSMVGLSCSIILTGKCFPF